jgi:hypothetical protein
MLYVIPSVGAVTVIVPVATAHVGCKVAAARLVQQVLLVALIVTLVEAEIHPAAF